MGLGFDESKEDKEGEEYGMMERRFIRGKNQEKEFVLIGRENVSLRGY